MDAFGERCFLIRGHLSPFEQSSLFAHIEENDCTPWGSLPKVMNPSPKTLLFGHNEPKMEYEIGDASPVADMVERAIEIAIKERRASPLADQLREKNSIKSLTMAAIRYLAPNARFPPHLDHCSNSFVFLASLGCTAKFMVKCGTEGQARTFDFKSGDLLVFDASTEAAVLHGVLGLHEHSCDVQDLTSRFPVLENHRYGVQCRLSFTL